MEMHYVCSGKCGSVADHEKVCEEGTCPMNGKPMMACDCEDGKHAKILEADQ